MSLSRSLVAAVTSLLLVGVMAAPAVAAPPPPANDDFANAITITALPYTKRVNTTHATTEGSDPTATCGSNDIDNNVWFAYTPGSTAYLHASTEGSRVGGGGGFDTMLAVFTNSGGFTEVDCDDDGGTDRLSDLAFTATGGTTYYFDVGTYAGDVYNHSAIRFNLELANSTLEAVVGAATDTNACSVHTTGAGLMPASNVYYNYGGGPNVLGTVAGDGTFDDTTSFVEQTYVFSGTTAFGDPIDTGNVVVFCH